MTTINRIRTTTKGNKYVANNWVATDAVEEYMAWLTKEFGAKAAKHTIETRTLAEGGKVLAFTKNGFTYDYEG